MIEKMKELWRAAFGDPEEFVELFFSAAYSPERCIFTGDAMAFWFDCTLDGRKLAYVYAVAVTPEKQGRGLGAALLRDLHRLLGQRGYDAVLLVPGEKALFRFYEKLGYTVAGYLNEFTVPAGVPIHLERLSTKEYARLRRQYPVVRQEGENLAFLEKMAEFYAGGDFLAAVDIRGKRCLELLGDPAAAPGLAAALGLEQCRVRAPGTRRPFVMAKSLTDAPLPEPIHFGFAFD